MWPPLRAVLSINRADTQVRPYNGLLPDRRIQSRAVTSVALLISSSPAYP